MHTFCVRATYNVAVLYFYRITRQVSFEMLRSPLVWPLADGLQKSQMAMFEFMATTTGEANTSSSSCVLDIRYIRPLCNGVFEQNFEMTHHARQENSRLRGLEPPSIASCMTYASAHGHSALMYRRVPDIWLTLCQYF